MDETTGIIYGLYCTCERCSVQPERIRYIGQTIIKPPSRRLDQHRFESRRDLAYLAVHLWMRKHGEYNVEMRELEESPRNLLNDRETFWIKEKRTFKDDSIWGLNLTRDGLGSEITDKSRKRQQESLRATRGRKKEEMITCARPGMTSEEVIQEIRTKYLEDRHLTAKEISRDYQLKDLKFIRDVLRNEQHYDPEYTPPETPNKAPLHEQVRRGIAGDVLLSKWEVAKEIRAVWLEKKLNAKQVGEKYNLDHTTVWHIISNRSYHDPEYINTRGRYVVESARSKISERLKGVPKPEGFGKRGEGNCKAVLTEEQVVVIIEKLHSGEKGIDVAEEFKVTPSAISYIKRGKTWTDVPRPEGFKP